MRFVRDEVIIRWLILHPSIAVSNHPLAPEDLNVVAYHAWTSTFNRSEGADEVWTHIVQPSTLLDWGIEPGENLQVVTNLISMEDHLVHASGIGHVDARVVENSARAYCNCKPSDGSGDLSPRSSIHRGKTTSTINAENSANRYSAAKILNIGSM